MSRPLYCSLALWFQTCPLNDVRFSLRWLPVKADLETVFTGNPTLELPTSIMKCEDRSRPACWWTWQRLFIAEVGHMGFPWVFPLCWAFFPLHRGCWDVSHRECRTDSIFDQENKCIFIPLFSGQAFRARKSCLSFCLCAGAQVSQKMSFFLFDKCTCFFFWHLSVCKIAWMCTIEFNTHC